MPRPSLPVWIFALLFCAAVGVPILCLALQLNPTESIFCDRLKSAQPWVTVLTGVLISGIVGVTVAYYFQLRLARREFIAMRRRTIRVRVKVRPATQRARP